MAGLASGETTHTLGPGLLGAWIVLRFETKDHFDVASGSGPNRM